MIFCYALQWWKQALAVLKIPLILKINRGLGFAYFERLLSDSAEFSRFRSAIAGSKDELVAMGYNAYTVEDFYDTFMELVDRLQPSGDDQESICDMPNAE